MHSEPFVSAIMPTRGRERWAREAVQMFLDQDYPRKELIALDDIMEPSFPHGLSFPGVRLVRHQRVTIGEKRNMTVSLSSGDIIIHWDSDDIYSPDRISHQVKHLLESEADLVGYHEMIFIDEERGKRYLYHASPGYSIGVSQCYWRETWESRKFDVVNEGEDSSFQANRKSVNLGCDGRIVARIHSGNTSEKRVPITQNPAQWELIA